MVVYRWLLTTKCQCKCKCAMTACKIMQKYSREYMFNVMKLLHSTYLQVSKKVLCMMYVYNVIHIEKHVNFFFFYLIFFYIKMYSIPYSYYKESTGSLNLQFELKP